jgi:hypothetical protein
VLSPRFLVVHDSSAGGQDYEAELTGRKQLHDPLLKVGELDVVARADNAGLVDATVELDDDFAVTMVIDFLELSNVACQIVSIWRKYKR